MGFAQKTIDFPKPVELTDAWLEEHKDHNLCFITQTEFKGKKGTKYEVCRCYWCKKIARRPIEAVSPIVKKHVPDKNI